MQQSFELSGVHCMHCVQAVKKALAPLADQVEVTLSPAIAVLTSEKPVSLDEVNKALAAAGDYKAQALD